MLTINDVAKAAGVSKATVSYALNGSDKISEATKARILEIAAEMNFVPNKNARILRKGKSMKVGLFIPFFSGSFYMYMIESMYQALRICGYNMEIHILKNMGAELISEIAGSNIDAAVVHHPFSVEEADSLVQVMSEKNIPVVFTEFEKVYSKASCVVTDNIGGITKIVEFLISTGHKKIAYFGGRQNYDEKKRHEAYRDVMEKHGLPIDDEWQYSGDDPSEWAGYQATRSQYSLLKELPDAICCANDPLAIGCIHALESFGHRIPKDISVTGFDNLIPAKLFEIKLTTIQNPISRMAQLAASEALRLLNPEETGKLTLVEVEFIKGDSTAIRITK